MPDRKIIEAAIGLSKDESKLLGLTIGSIKVAPGQHILKKEAQPIPELSFNRDTGTYIVVCIDLDAPFPSFSILSPTLHWIQSGLKPSRAPDSSTILLNSDDPFIVDYAGPGPPPGSGPHRYVFMLYEQPEGFEITKFAPSAGKKVGIPPRVRYDLNAFEKEAKLGLVVASNYFLSN